MLFSKIAAIIRRQVPLKLLLRNTVRTKTIKNTNVGLFGRYLLLTNAVSSGLCMAIGDFLQQEISNRYTKSANIDKDDLDWERIAHMFIVGTGLGVIHHHYYVYLDKLLPKVSAKNVLIKVAADQFLNAPITIAIFFYSLGVLESKTSDECFDEIRQKFLHTYVSDWCFWPPIQFLNFYYVSAKYRVLVINLATMVFNTYLSYMKFVYKT